MSRPAIRCPYTRPFDDRGTLEIVAAWARTSLGALKGRAFRLVQEAAR